MGLSQILKILSSFRPPAASLFLEAASTLLGQTAICFAGHLRDAVLESSLPLVRLTRFRTTSKGCVQPPCKGHSVSVAPSMSQACEAQELQCMEQLEALVSASVGLTLRDEPSVDLVGKRQKAQMPWRSRKP